MRLAHAAHLGCVFLVSLLNLEWNISDLISLCNNLTSDFGILHLYKIIWPSEEFTSLSVHIFGEISCVFDFKKCSRQILCLEAFLISY